MSDATRAVALSEAIKLSGVGQADSTQILIIAKQFDDFLNLRDEIGTQLSSTPGKEPAKPTGGRPTGTKPATGGKKPAKSEEEVVKDALQKQRDEAAAVAVDEAAAINGDVDSDLTEVTEYPPNKEGVQAVIARMLQANKRKEAIALLKKFNAASATGVKEKDAAKFIAEALKIAGVEAERSSDDLTA